MTRRAALIAVVAFAVGMALILRNGASPEDRAVEVAGAGSAAATDDALGWDPSRADELAERAALGTSHVIYANSPEGVLASAKRTAAWRKQVERAAAAHGIEPDRLEALVFLESAGRPQVMAGPTPEAASGLTQITPSAATELLDMHVNLELSERLTRQIGRAQERGQGDKALKLSRRRMKADERFDPRRALEGAGRYLEIATERFGEGDLATVSYHMGIGNLESVIRAYAGDESDAPIGETVAAEELSYAQLFFDSAPDRHPEAHELLAGFGDDSSEYFWKILASEQIMEQWRSDREALKRTAELATNKATLEEVFHPEDETEAFEEPDDVEEAVDDEDLLPLPDVPEQGWKADEQMGELAARLDREPELYRALRPEALATLAYMGQRVRELSGAERPLKMTSTVRDDAYQELLSASNPEATHAYSLHTTGFSFDILRDYANDRQAAAFQFVLDRLQALAVIDYAVEPRAIHVTVSDLGVELVAP